MSTKLVVLALAANFALLSCAPKDEKVIRPGGTASAQAVVTASDAVKLLLISLDRPVEALHYLKAALNADYATQKKMNVENISTNVKKISVVVGADAKSAPVQDILQATITMTDDNSAVSSVLIQDLFTKKIEAKQVTQTSSFKTLAKQISVTKVSDKTDVYAVEITSLEETNSIAGGNGLSNTFANFTISWNGKADSLDSVLITAITAMGHNKYSVTKFTAKSSDADFASALTVTLGADCTKLNGTVNLTSTSNPKKGQPANPVFSLTLTDSSATVDGAVKYTAAECASRPVVDTAKLF